MKTKKELYNELCDLNKKCSNCGLCCSANNIVVGSGDINAKIMFVGEAPGKQEDLEGIPFIGRSGKKLDKILSNIGLSRENIYITNTICCRPPNNRNPNKEEIDTCRLWLENKIDIIKPRVICTLGNVPLQYFKGNAFSISKVHGKVLDLEEYKCRIVPLYHPALSLYRPTTYKIMVEDIKILDELVSCNS
jgi:uracil-DNA glycosylase